jgi:uncharacterized protein YcbK (DUF882 family)
MARQGAMPAKICPPAITCAQGAGMSDNTDAHDALAPSRRRFLQRAAGCAGLLLAPLGAVGAQASAARRVSFVHTHTGEMLAADYCRGGVYQANGLAQVDRLLRDFRNGEMHPIDPRLLDILYELQVRADREMTYEVISGYRSPQTNAALNRASSGVAARSLHMEGRAIDVRATGIPTRKLRDFALSLRSGGVGFYARPDFLHLDTGRVRTWAG